MRFLIILLFSVLSFIGCKSDKQNEWTAYPPLSRTGSELPMGYDGLLVHIVFFPLKVGITEKEKQDLILEIEKLNQIDQVIRLSVGNFSDLEDKRALDQYGVAMTMGFKSSAEYKTYQNHPIHLQLKKDVAKYLSGPPATYDFKTIE